MLVQIVPPSPAICIRHPTSPCDDFSPVPVAEATLTYAYRTPGPRPMLVQAKLTFPYRDDLVDELFDAPQRWLSCDITASDDGLTTVFTYAHDADLPALRTILAKGVVP